MNTTHNITNILVNNTTYILNDKEIYYILINLIDFFN